MANSARQQSDSSDADSSEREESRVVAATTKRRRTDASFVPTFKQDLSGSSDSEAEESEDSDVGNDDHGAAASDAKDVSAAGSIAEQDDIHPSRKGKRGITSLTREELDAVNQAKARSGVIYLSKVPPFMKPQKVKHLLTQYGETNRIFLAPEDPKSYAKRVRFGGNKRRMFVEGWIEFLDKKKAKLVAETLNTRPIGGKKKSFYHDDLWNLKYLPKFKWDDLTAQIAAENASRQVRLANEIEAGKKEAQHYLKNAERAKMIQNIQATRAAKRDASVAGEAPSASLVVKHHAVAPPSIEGHPAGEERMRRRFNQRDVKDKTKDATFTNKDEKMKKVMSSIF